MIRKERESRDAPCRVSPAASRTKTVRYAESPKGPRARTYVQATVYDRALCRFRYHHAREIPSTSHGLAFSLDTSLNSESTRALPCCRRDRHA